MADQEEDFSSLPLSDRFTHKNWKVRKEAYEAAAKEFDNAQTEQDPVVRQFAQDASLWKAAVSDSNVAAHQEAVSALCSFLQIAGTSGCTRTRHSTIAPLAEKALISTKPVTKQKALEAILLYVELDKADPVIEELLPLLSHKLPKIVAATLGAFTAIYHSYGTKTVDPKPVVKTLPKVFGHADKNVRAEAQNLTVEFYKWLRESIKPLFWNDLKPVQQTDLEKLFEVAKNEPVPKPERLLRSQQAAAARAPVAGPGGADDGADGEEEEDEYDAEPEMMAVNVFAKIPKDVNERLASTKWKDRKDALDDLYTAVDAPAIEEGPFDEIMRGLAKSMKDANIAVVTVAGNCVERLANGLKKKFAKYRSTVFAPIMDRLKERKQSVTDALAGALDAICSATSLSDCLEDTVGFLAHKNPLVKLEATRFLNRALKLTREAPNIADTKLIADATSKLLTDSQETQRSAAAEVLGTLWKIMGDRVMGVHFEPLDDIRKAKIKEYYDSAEVKAKHKPKAAPAPKAAPPPAQKKMVAKKPAGSGPPPARKPAPAAAPPPVEPASPAPLAAKPTARQGLARPGSIAGPRGLKPPSTASAGRKLAAPPGISSPTRPTHQKADSFEDDPLPTPKLSRGLAGRQLTKPTAAPSEPAPSATSAYSLPTPLPSAERLELDELRAESERLRNANESLRADHLKLASQVNELQNQNAQLIEDHTRDILSIKAKETQLVRARSDAEAAEQTVSSMQREVDRLKRELTRMGRATSPNSGLGSPDMLNIDAGFTSALGGPGDRRTLMGPPTASALAEGKENAHPADASKRLLSPHSGRPNATADRPSSMSPRRARPNSQGVPAYSAYNTNGHAGYGTGVLSDSDARSSASSSSTRPSGGGPADDARAAGDGVESWKRAAEVTQNLKARIELMKARQQGMSRQ